LTILQTLLAIFLAMLVLASLLWWIGLMGVNLTRWLPRSTSHPPLPLTAASLLSDHFLTAFSPQKASSLVEAPLKPTGIPLHALCSLAWVGLLVISGLSVGIAPRAEVSLAGIQQTVFINLALAGILLVTLMVERPDWRMEFTLLKDQRTWQTFAIGLLAIPAAILCTLLLLSPWRTEATQHPLLSLLAKDPASPIVAWIGCLVTIVAPLTEELVFRVSLQPFLSHYVSRPIAISVVAICFCLAHGPLDGLALAPLALILGLLYATFRSAIGIMLLHATFNGVMLVTALVMVE
jgi:membrane protease YdiL (CAAX protease family)